jgi:hypothetical protein
LKPVGVEIVDNKLNTINDNVHIECDWDGVLRVNRERERER